MGRRHLYWILTGPSFAACLTLYGKARAQRSSLPAVWIVWGICAQPCTWYHTSKSTSFVVLCRCIKFLTRAWSVVECSKKYWLIWAWPERTSPYQPPWVQPKEMGAVFHQKAAEILAHRQHCPSRQFIFFAWLFWAAGCQIDFRQEGYLNL